MVLDLDSGCVAFAVLSVGGFLGVGNKDFAVPWPVLSPSLSEKRFTTGITHNQLENAPPFDKANWLERVNRSWLENMYGHYGQPPYWTR